MTIQVTVELVEAVYEMLRMTKPFKGWKLPHADDISFAMIRKPGTSGEFYVNPNGIPYICINDKFHHTLQELMKTVAHEMCHLYEHLYYFRQDIHHGAIFRQCADRVCRIHQFDRGAF